MKRNIAAGATAAVVAIATITQPVLAADQCMTQSEKAAFEMHAVQSTLMVTALQCGQHDAYNRFVLQHQRDLNDSYHQITSYFARVNGSSGEQERDAYITDLANQHSDQSNWPNFCSTMGAFAAQALTLQGSDQVAQFVADKQIIVQHMTVCRTEYAATPQPTMHTQMDWSRR